MAEAGEATLLDPGAGGARPLAAALLGIAGILAGEVFPIRRGSNRFGSAPDCDVVWSHEDVAPVDLVIEATAEGLRLETRDGRRVLVSGEETEQTRLRDGDTLRVGDSTFRVRLA